MFVLGVVGVIVALLFLYWLFEYLNNYSLDHYKYEFYSGSRLIVVIIGYWCLFFGHGMYEEALKNSGDILNGQALMGIGALLVFLILYNNFKAVPMTEAIFLSALELLLCVPLAYGAFFLLLAAVAFFSDTKPVYVINND